MQILSKLKVLMCILLHLLFVLFVFFSNELVFILFLHFLDLLFFLSLSNYFIESFGIVVIDIFIHSCFKSLHELLLNFLFNVGCDKSLGLSYPISLLCFLFDRNEFFLSLQFQFSHLDNHLS